MRSFLKAFCAILWLPLIISTTDDVPTISTIDQESTTSSVLWHQFFIHELNRYENYGDVTLLPTTLPSGLSEAIWNITITSVGNGCDKLKSSLTGSLVIKYGSAPVVSPDNSEFPENFLPIRPGIPQYELNSFNIDKPIIVKIPAPASGTWITIVFLDYQDPREKPIQQSGLHSKCYITARSSINVTYHKTIIDGVTGNITLQRKTLAPEQFRIATPHLAWKMKIRARLTDCKQGDNLVICPPWRFVLSPASLAPPYRNNTSMPTAELLCETDVCDLIVSPFATSWHYAAFYLDRFENSLTALALIQVIALPCNEDCWNIVPAMRLSFGTLFSWDIVRAIKSETAALRTLELNPNRLTTLSFDLRAAQDSGGTFGLGIQLEKETQNNSPVFGCLSLGTRSEPTLNGTCSLEGWQSPFPAVPIILNSTKKEAESWLNIPFPEDGTWHLSFISEKAVNVSWLAGSHECDRDQCGDLGRCQLFLLEGWLVSVCECFGGVMGWACTDTSKADPRNTLLLAVLLLTISNVPFLIAAYVTARTGRTAPRVRLFAEACLYLATGFASAFYHACEAGGKPYSWCLVSLNTLQFMDFFLAAYSAWVTLLALAEVPDLWRGVGHCLGAVLVAFLAHLDRRSATVLLGPATAGALIVIWSWGRRCYGSQSCHPQRYNFYKFLYFYSDV